MESICRREFIKVLLRSAVSGTFVGIAPALGSPEATQLRFAIGDGQTTLTGSMYDQFKRSMPLCGIVNESGGMRSFRSHSLLGESLSVAQSPHGRTAMTFPGSSSVLKWDTKDKNPRAFEISEPRGVLWCKTGFIVSSAGDR